MKMDLLRMFAWPGWVVCGALLAMTTLSGCDEASSRQTVLAPLPTDPPRAGVAAETVASLTPPNNSVDAVAKVLVVGVDGSNAPFASVTDRNQVVGFDVDVANEIAKRLRRPLKIETIVADSAPRSLVAGDRDLIIMSLGIVTDADPRLKDIDLSHVYYETTQVVVVKGAARPIDLRAVSRVGVARATPADNAVSDLLGRGSSSVARYSSVGLALRDLEADALGAVVAERGMVRNYMISMPGSKLAIVPDVVLAAPAERYYIAARKGGQQLLGQVNAALDDIRADGTYDALYARYFGPAR